MAEAEIQASCQRHIMDFKAETVSYGARRGMALPVPAALCAKIVHRTQRARYVKSERGAAAARALDFVAYASRLTLPVSRDGLFHPDRRSLFQIRPAAMAPALLLVA